MRIDSGDWPVITDAECDAVYPELEEKIREIFNTTDIATRNTCKVPIESGEELDEFFEAGPTIQTGVIPCLNEVHRAVHIDSRRGYVV